MVRSMPVRRLSFSGGSVAGRGSNTGGGGAVAKQKRTSSKRRVSRQATKKKMVCGWKAGMQIGFRRPVYKVFKALDATQGMRMRTGAMHVMDSALGDILDRFGDQLTSLLKKTGRKTASKRDVTAAVRLVLPGDLSYYAVQDGEKAVEKFLAEGGR